MIQPRIPRFAIDPFTKRINRAPSPVLARSTPWVMVIVASMIPAWPVIASAPLAPPLGFMVLLAWRQVRPGLLPVWAGLPLGMIDDIYSGQPFGSAVLLWSAAMILLDMAEVRFPWRNFLLDWLLAAGLVTAYILIGVALANGAGGDVPIRFVVPQVLMAVLFFPLAGRAVALADRFRLLPFAKVD